KPVFFSTDRDEIFTEVSSTYFIKTLLISRQKLLIKGSYSSLKNTRFGASSKRISMRMSNIKKSIFTRSKETKSNVSHCRTITKSKVFNLEESFCRKKLIRKKLDFRKSKIKKSNTTHDINFDVMNVDIPKIRH